MLGSVFFLMERRHGLILRDGIPPRLAKVPNYAERVSEAFIDCLIRLHAIDISRTGLIALGKPEGFLECQVQVWADRWKRAATGALPQDGPRDSMALRSPAVFPRGDPRANARA